MLLGSAAEGQRGKATKDLSQIPVPVRTDGGLGSYGGGGVVTW